MNSPRKSRSSNCRYTVATIPPRIARADIPQACTPQSGPPQAGGLADLSRWLTERDSAEMASPKAMSRRDGYGRVPALAGGHIHNEAWRATPPDPVISLSPHPGGVPEAGTMKYPPQSSKPFSHKTHKNPLCEGTHQSAYRRAGDSHSQTTTLCFLWPKNNPSTQTPNSKLLFFLFAPFVPSWG